MNPLARAAAVMLATAPYLGSAHAREVVTVEPVAAVELLVAREAFARVYVRVRPGFHVQANPVLDPALIPIVFALQPSGGLQPGAPVYPPAKRFRLQGTDDDLVVLDGRFAIRIPIRASADAAPGKIVLRGALRFQACDHEHCLFPRTLPVDVPVRVRRP